MKPAILKKIQDAIRDGQYRFSEHALVELAADALHAVDAESAILTGHIVRTQLQKPRKPGPRYTIVGKATDLYTNVAVICRLDEVRQVFIITAYEMHE